MVDLIGCFISCITIILGMITSVIFLNVVEYGLLIMVRKIERKSQQRRRRSQ